MDTIDDFAYFTDFADFKSALLSAVTHYEHSKNPHLQLDYQPAGCGCGPEGLSFFSTAAQDNIPAHRAENIRKIRDAISSTECNVLLRHKIETYVNSPAFPRGLSFWGMSFRQEHSGLLRLINIVLSQPEFNNEQLMLDKYYKLASNVPDHLRLARGHELIIGILDDLSGTCSMLTDKVARLELRSMEVKAVFQTFIEDSPQKKASTSDMQEYLSDDDVNDTSMYAGPK